MGREPSLRLLEERHILLGARVWQGHVIDETCSPVESRRVHVAAPGLRGARLGRNGAIPRSVIPLQRLGEIPKMPEVKTKGIAEPDPCNTAGEVNGGRGL